MHPRVLITGIGLVTPLGISARTTWQALVSGATAVRPHTFHPSIPVRIAATVDRTSLPNIPPLLSSCPEYAAFALIAAQEALADASLLTLGSSPKPVYLPERAGVSIGVGMGHLEEAASAAREIGNGRFRRISPYMVPRLLANTPAGLVSMRFMLKGPVLSPSTACAAGGHAIMDGFHAIQRSEVDVMVVGGTEAEVNDIAAAGFSRAKALTTKYNDSPKKASRPFDKQRDGFVLADGAALLVLESEHHARERGAAAYAEIVGVGTTGDAFHITSPMPDGDGAYRAMRMAIEAAGKTPKDVDYVNAHATSTPVGDAVERLAIARILDVRKAGDGAIVSSTKGATGHLLAGAGGIEAAFVALAIAEGVVPPTVNLEEVDQHDDVDEMGWADVQRYVPQVAKKMEVRFGLSNSFGFGGTNTCVALAEPDGFERKTVRNEAWRASGGEL